MDIYSQLLKSFSLILHISYLLWHDNFFPFILCTQFMQALVCSISLSLYLFFVVNTKALCCVVDVCYLLYVTLFLGMKVIQFGLFFSLFLCTSEISSFLYNSYDFRVLCECSFGRNGISHLMSSFISSFFCFFFPHLKSCLLHFLAQHSAFTFIGDANVVIVIIDS